MPPPGRLLHRFRVRGEDPRRPVCSPLLEKSLELRHVVVERQVGPEVLVSSSDDVEDFSVFLPAGRLWKKPGRRHDEANAALTVLRKAEYNAAVNLRAVFEGGAEEIVECLRSAQDAMLAQARKLAPKLQGATTTKALVALQSEAALKAWQGLGTLFLQHRAIRDAYVAVFDAVFVGCV